MQRLLHCGILLLLMEKWFWLQSNMTVVEISNLVYGMAKKWFGLEENDRHHVIIEDGLKFVQEASKRRMVCRFIFERCGYCDFEIFASYAIGSGDYMQNFIFTYRSLLLWRCANKWNISRYTELFDIFKPLKFSRSRLNKTSFRWSIRRYLSGCVQRVERRENAVSHSWVLPARHSSVHVWHPQTNW